jgi:hypothetical protein
MSWDSFKSGSISYENEYWQKCFISTEFYALNFENIFEVASVSDYKKLLRYETDSISVIFSKNYIDIGGIFMIYKLPDDYYLVSTPLDEFFKCDQFDGLTKFIEEGLKIFK